MRFSPLLWLIRAFGALLAHALSPSSCAACDVPLARRRVFCPICAATVLPSAARGQETLAFAVFGGAIAVALRRLKYEDRADLAYPLGELLRGHLRQTGTSADLVVPVPLHPKRLAERGYNQAALLARAAARELGVPFAAIALRRARDTPKQALLGKAARLVNVSGAFVVRDASLVRGKKVLVVDDVETTGATLRACREALFAAGATSVVTACLARAGDVGEGG